MTMTTNTFITMVMFTHQVNLIKMLVLETPKLLPQLFYLMKKEKQKKMLKKLAVNIKQKLNLVLKKI